jgi:hypothetical protein
MLGGREKIFSAGCNGYFEKSIDPITIMIRIYQMLKTKNVNKVSDKKNILPLQSAGYSVWLFRFGLYKPNSELDEGGL